jgi:cysteine synthase A
MTTLYLPYYVLHPFSLVPNFLRPSRIGGKPSLILGLICGFSLSITLNSLTKWFRHRWKKRWTLQPSVTRDSHGTNIRIKSEEIVDGIEGLIGNTPLIRINSLSDLLGGGDQVEIFGKCEFMNPFGSVKDRVSLRIIQQAEQEGLIHPNTNSTIFEGTSGSTGISIAGIAKARGYNAHIVLPDDVAQEKINMLEIFGAKVEKVRPVSIVDKKHYVNLARKRALQFGTGHHESVIRSTVSNSTPSRSPLSLSRVNSSNSIKPDLLITQHDNDKDDRSSNRDQPRGLFADQFENLSNYTAHSLSTAPEIYQQTSGLIDAFVSGAGTGGTIAGVGKTLKKLTRNEIEIVLSDPEGSGLYYWIKEGVMWNEKEEEGKRRRFQVDTIVEGIGLNRITKNLKLALPIIDDAFRVTDQEALSMSRHLAEKDGLFLGSSSAVNLVTCVRLAQKWIREGKAEKMGLNGTRKLRIVTILCDSGSRHTSKFW